LFLSLGFYDFSHSNSTLVASNLDWHLGLRSSRSGALSPGTVFWTSRGESELSCTRARTASFLGDCGLR
ncbi:unnamed protein product, partial [Prunus brigantina]